MLIAACVEAHEHHERAIPIMKQVHDRKAEGFTSGHALLEFYAILTRFPRSPRMLPQEVALLLRENILRRFTAVALTAEEYGAFVVDLGSGNIMGGQSYDALHMACAKKCEADRIYTFNVAHFQNVSDASLRQRIMSP